MATAKKTTEKKEETINLTETFQDITSNEGKPLFMEIGEVFTGVFLGVGRVMGDKKDVKKQVETFAMADVETPKDAVMEKRLIPQHTVIKNRISTIAEKMGMSEMIGKVVLRITKIPKIEGKDYENYKIEARILSNSDEDKFLATRVGDLLPIG